MAQARRPDAAPALPVWPAPSPQVATTAAAAEVAIASWRASKPAAVAIYVAARGSGAWADPDDHRHGEPWAIALARDRAAPDVNERETLVLADGALSAVDTLLQWFAQPEAPYVVAHGAQATLARLWRLAGEPLAPARLGCTRTAAVLLGEGAGDPREHELRGAVAAQLQRALMLPHWIPEQEHDGRVQCAAAAAAVLSLVATMVPRLRSLGAIAAYQLECELVPAVVAMELAGTPCDAAAFERVAAGWRAEKLQATAAERVTRLDKLISTYGHWPQDFVRADRIHARLHPLAADSGRFSCTDPNLQQVPSEHTAPGLRACFRAPPGMALVVADYAQIELRVAAQLAPCDALAAVFHEGRDPHRATAATLSGKPEPEVTAHERKLAKAVNFGFLFGMGAERFRDYARSGYGLELDLAAARRAREAFFTTFPGLAAWHRRVAERCRGPGPHVVRTALGRRKRFPDDAVSVPAALNIPVQGTAAEGFKRAMIGLHAALPRLGARGVLVVHDEYLAEVPADRAQDVRAHVVEIMQTQMATVVSRVPIVVEAEVVDCWR